MGKALTYALALGMSILGPAQMAGQEPLKIDKQDYAQVWRVPVRVWVKDNQGNYVRGLGEDDFYVEKGKGRIKRRIKPLDVDEYSATDDDFSGVCLRVGNDSSRSVIRELTGGEDEVLPVEATETGVRLSAPYRQVLEDGQKEIGAMRDSNPQILDPKKSLISGGVFGVKSIFSPYVQATEIGKIADYLGPRLVDEYLKIEGLKDRLEKASSKEAGGIRVQLEEAVRLWNSTALYHNMAKEARLLEDLTPACRDKNKALVLVTDGLDTVLERYGEIDKGPGFIQDLRDAYSQKDYQDLLGILANRGIVPVPVYAVMRKVSGGADTRKIMEFKEAVAKSGGKEVELGAGKLGGIFPYVLEKESNHYVLYFSHESMEGIRSVKPKPVDGSLTLTYSEPVITKPDESMLNSVFRNQKDYSNEDVLVAAMAASQGFRQGIGVVVDRGAILTAIRHASDPVVLKELQTARYALDLSKSRYGTEREKKAASEDIGGVPEGIASGFCPPGQDKRLLALDNVLCSDGI
ncbi:MAG: hypothetical protein HY518_04660 [Candidatus Aenigmarchaeota archaeon]|nr:hypothetical protein [Candidatus Aenigmarchaeota archaeon]